MPELIGATGPVGADPEGMAVDEAGLGSDFGSKRSGGAVGGDEPIECRCACAGAAAKKRNPATPARMERSGMRRTEEGMVVLGTAR